MISGYGASYPGIDLTPLQLLNALDQKLNEESSCNASIQAAADENESAEIQVKSLRVQAGIRFRQNASNSAIHRLNPECMALIFRFVSNECHAKLCGTWTSPYDWIAISHVCRCWRSTSLSFPSTWSIFDSSSPTLAQICLERSKASVLDVYIRSGCSEKLLQVLLPHTSRFRDFHSTLTSQEHMTMFEHFKNAPAPLLQSLNFDIPDAAATPPSEKISNSPFVAPLPLLMRLSLAHFPIGNWTKNFTGLTSLALRDNRVDFPSLLTAFLDFLELSPGLECLEIISTIFFRDNVDLRQERVVSLNNLKTLILRSCDTQAILSHLKVPPGCHLNFTNLSVHGSEGVVTAIFPESFTNLQPLNGMRNLFFGRGSGIYFSLKGAGPNGSFDINVRATDAPLFTAKSFPLFPQGGIPDLSELWLDNFVRNIEIGAQPLPGIITMLNSQSLKTLILNKCMCTPFIAALMPYSDGTTPSPSLTSLTIFNDRKLSISKLWTLAEARKLKGFPFKHITIICHPVKMLPAKEVLALKTCVDTVDYKLDDEGPRWTTQWTQ